MTETMTYQITQIDTERERITKRQRSEQELRAAMVQIRALARKIRGGDYDPRPISPRQMRQYGRTVPMQVVLRCTIGYHRTFDLGQRHRIGMVIGAEHESFVHRRQEYRIANQARMIRRRRRVTRVV